MNQSEATNVAKTLLQTHGDRAFELSMPDQAGYELMRTTFAQLGRPTDPSGESFVLKVFPGMAGVGDGSDTELPGRERSNAEVRL